MSHVKAFINHFRPAYNTYRKGKRITMLFHEKELFQKAYMEWAKTSIAPFPLTGCPECVSECLDRFVEVHRAQFESAQPVNLELTPGHETLGLNQQTGEVEIQVMTRPPAFDLDKYKDQTNNDIIKILNERFALSNPLNLEIPKKYNKAILLDLIQKTEPAE